MLRICFLRIVCFMIVIGYHYHFFCHHFFLSSAITIITPSVSMTVYDTYCHTGGTYFYGGVDAAHPKRLQHPSRFHGAAAPVMALLCAPGDEECREAGCKKALGRCAATGLEDCIRDGGEPRR